MVGPPQSSGVTEINKPQRNMAEKKSLFNAAEVEYTGKPNKIK